MCHPYQPTRFSCRLRAASRLLRIDPCRLQLALRFALAALLVAAGYEAVQLRLRPLPGCDLPAYRRARLHHVHAFPFTACPRSVASILSCVPPYPKRLFVPQAKKERSGAFGPAQSGFSVRPDGSTFLNIRAPPRRTLPGLKTPPPLAPPEKLAGEAEHLALGLYHAGCRKLRVGRGPSRSAHDFDPWRGLSPLRRSIVAIVGRRPAGGWVPVREAFKERPTKPRARSSCAKTLAQGAWRDQNPKPARPKSRREPTPGSRTRNGAPDQASTRLPGY